MKNSLLLLLCLISGPALFSEEFFQGIEILDQQQGGQDFFAGVALDQDSPQSQPDPFAREIAQDLGMTLSDVRPQDAPHLLLTSLQNRVRQPGGDTAKNLFLFARALLLYGRRPEFMDQQSAMLRVAESSLRKAVTLSADSEQREYVAKARELLSREFGSGSTDTDQRIRQIQVMLDEGRLMEAESSARELAHRTTFTSRPVLRLLEGILRQRASREADSERASLLTAEANFIASTLAESEAEAQLIQDQVTQAPTGQGTDSPVELTSATEINRSIESAHLKTRANQHEEALEIYRELARKTGYRSAKVRFYLGSHQIVMAGMDQFRSRREELRREGNSHLTEARNLGERHLDQFPDNRQFSETALRLMQELDTVTVTNSSEASVDEQIRIALGHNDQNRKQEGLQVLQQAVERSSRKSAKALYFLGKQYLLVQERTKALTALRAARDLSASHLQEFTQNGVWAAHAREKLLEEEPVQTPAPVEPSDRPVAVAPEPEINRSQTLIKPVSGTVTSVYGMRTHPIHRTRRMHTGLDIGAARGTPLKAMANGKVIFAGWMSGYGNTLKIQYDNGYESLYAHMKNFNGESGTSRVNQRVRAGQKVGEVNSTGSSTGDHLHLELKRNGQRISPAEVLGKSNRAGETI